jgi:L-ascorbate metabolism protein UlaG (beta-lactamase superfamily)
MVKISPIPAAPHRPEPLTWTDDRLTAAWLGHATVLLNFFGVRIITDPVLESRVGIGRGLAKLGPRRLVRPALRARELPPLDLVLLSHAHMDHTDLGTLRSLRRDVPEVGGVRIQSVEVRHWGARMVTDRHRGYGGFLLTRRGTSVLFAGDTAYTDAFDRLGRHTRVELAILPIGAYDPWIANHASPEQAWRMFQGLGARHLLPVHHSTFRLSREPVDEPLERLRAAAGAEEWRIVTPEVGSTWTLARS